MKQSLTLLTIAISIFTLISCKGKEDDKSNNNVIIPANTTANSVNPDTLFQKNNNLTPAPLPVNNGSGNLVSQNATITPNLPNTVVQQQLPTVIQQTQAPTANVAPGMNPPHGMPGHRCDISVGAPLNSPSPAPTPTANPATPPVTVVKNPAPLPAPISVSGPQPKVAKTAPGMNPPHGEPGHRCEIAVGAPLDSKPVAPTPVQVAPTVVPVKKDSLN